MSAVPAIRALPVALRWLIPAAMLLLGGCAALQPSPSTGPATPLTSPAARHAAHVAALTAFTPWRLAGRIAVKRDDKGFSADLDWREAGDVFSLRVAAPLNGGTYALSGNGKAVSLVSSKGDIFSAADAETLMQEHLGWALPLAGARYWVRGLPDPGRAVSAEQLDDAGRWTRFTQDGWRVSVTEYTHAADRDLPRRLFLARDNFEVRMAIKTWEQR